MIHRSMCTYNYTGSVHTFKPNLHYLIETVVFLSLFVHFQISTFAINLPSVKL